MCPPGATGHAHELGQLEKRVRAAQSLIVDRAGMLVAVVSRGDSSLVNWHHGLRAAGAGGRRRRGRPGSACGCLRSRPVRYLFAASPPGPAQVGADDPSRAQVHGLPGLPAPELHPSRVPAHHPDAFLAVPGRKPRPLAAAKAQPGGDVLLRHVVKCTGGRATKPSVPVAGVHV